jgi:16S rRNA (adenine(1408)-N(1))-methyltransferase
VTNAVFVVASVEDPPPELTDVADEVDVIYPWAALLRGVLRPEDAVLRGLRTLAKPGARVELVLTYDASRDRGTGLDPSAPSLDERFIERLRGPYRAAGLEMQAYRRLSDEEALAIPSTWGHRLLHGRARQVFMVELATR